MEISPVARSHGSSVRDAPRSAWPVDGRHRAVARTGDGRLRGRARTRRLWRSRPSRDRTDRRSVTHLEALGRLMAGIAPWLELATDASAEGRARADYGDLARRAIARIVGP